MTAAAPARGTQIIPIDALLSISSLEDGWVKLPHSFPKALWRCVTPNEYIIAELIWDETVGGPRGPGGKRPEWANRDQAWFAEFANASIQGVQKALSLLEKKRLIESRPVGRSREYRVLLEEVKKLELTLRPKRSVDRGIEPVSNPKTVTIAPGTSGSVALGKAVECVTLKNDLPKAIRLTVDSTDTVELHIQGSETLTRVDVSTRSHPSETTTRVGVSLTQLVDFLRPFFLENWGKVVDEAIAIEILEALEGAPLQMLAAVIQSRRKRGKFDSGLLVNLAREAALAHKARGTPAPSGFVPDPAPEVDHSTPWNRVRAQLQRVLEPWEYAVFAASRQIEANPRGIRVALLDEEQRRMIQDSLAPAVREALSQIRMPGEVVFLVQQRS